VVNLDGLVWPIWVLVLLCGAATQVTKLVLYSVVERRLALHVLGESVGLPSLHASVLTCLTTLLTLQYGWQATMTGLSLVLTVIVLHDVMRVKGASQAQNAVLAQLVAYIPQAGSLQRGVTSLLTSFAHQPFHVAMGALYGLIFALATGTRGN
jgi:acid phosphatase family membrane protein YuiD